MDSLEDVVPLEISMCSSWGLFHELQGILCSGATYEEKMNSKAPKLERMYQSYDHPNGELLIF